MAATSTAITITQTNIGGELVAEDESESFKWQLRRRVGSVLAMKFISFAVYPVYRARVGDATERSIQFQQVISGPDRTITWG
jgi:hypothetical protein